MTQARRRAIQRRLEKRVRTVEVDDGVAAGDVKGEGIVELDALMDFIGGDAGVGYERSGSDHEALGLRVDGLDRVGVVEGVEYE